jgi:transcriptional regulator with XRE-family HTH domain
MRTQAETLGQFIRRIREGKDLTLRLVAKRARISPSYLSDIELDRRSFSPRTLIALSKALRIDQAELAEALTQKRIGELQAEMDALRAGK